MYICITAEDFSLNDVEGIYLISVEFTFEGICDTLSGRPVKWASSCMASQSSFVKSYVAMVEITSGTPSLPWSNEM